MDRNFVKRFLKGSVATSFGTLATVAFHFLSVALMTRYVDQRELGIYFLILAVANGGKTLGSLGLDLTLVKFLSSEQKLVQQNAFQATLIIRVVVMILLSLLIILFGSIISPLVDLEVVDLIVYVPVLIILMSFRELFFFLLQGLNKFWMYASVQTASAILKAALILLLSSSLDLATLIYIEFAMLISSMVIQFMVIPFRELLPGKIGLDRQVTRSVLGFGFPLYINSLLTYVSNFGGTFVVGLFLTPVSIAAYEVSAKIPQGVNRLFQSFSTVYFPTLSSLFAKNDLASARKLINKSLVILASATFATVLLSQLFSYEIVSTLFTDQYLEVQTTFVLLMLSICLQLLAFTMGYSLVAAGVPQKSTKVNMVGMGSELVMSLIFVPLMGYTGVAVSFIIQTMMAQVMCSYYLRSVNVIVDAKTLAKPYLILGATSFGYIFLDNDLLVTKAAVFLAYVGLSIWFVPDCRQAITYLWDMVQQARQTTRRAPLVSMPHGETAHGVGVIEQSFLSTISHDLRTPLSTILGFAELMYNNRETLSEDQQKKFLEHIIKNANLLMRNTQTAMDILSLETNPESLDLETWPLDGSIRRWLADNCHQSLGRIVYQGSTDHDTPARFVPSALYRILTILVDFAVAESPVDEPVTISLVTNATQAHVTVRHKAQTMRPSDSGEVTQPRLNQMQLYVASLLAQRQQGYLTLHVQPDQICEMDLVLRLATDSDQGKIVKVPDKL